MEFHEAANVFPLLEGEEFVELVADINANGLLVPIETLEGKVLDGRNRWRACDVLKIKPDTIEVDLDGMTAIDYVLSLNLKRRHLGTGGRGMVSVAVENYEANEAKKRQRMSEGRGVKGPVKLPDLNGDARDKAAAQLKVSGKTTSDCKKVQGKGSAELVAATWKDKVPPSVAAKMIDATGGDKARQTQAVEDVKAGKTPATALREIVAENHQERLESIEAVEAKAIEGVYDVIVVDPPWPLAKTGRDCRPMQSETLDYPTMDVGEMTDIEIPAAENCHLFCWTTQKFLPDTFELLKDWGFTYSFTMVWHKGGGPQPLGLPQFNCEFVVYGRRGKVQFIDTKAFNLCFDGKRGKHSEKPQEFYDVLRRVTAGRRIDMFSRREIEGFDGWGNQSQ